MDQSSAVLSGAAARLAGPDGRRERLRHAEFLPPRSARAAEWPAWVDPQVRLACQAQGIANPWLHQALAADLAWRGQNVALATGTASGKSLGYLLPGLTAVLEGGRAPSGRAATVLYLAPTKALAGDQLAAIERLDLPGIRAATYDGDTDPDQRRWVRDHANLVLTNPDLLHHSLLPGHKRWASFLRHLRYVVVDESHQYRGLFGSHVAAILRRLRRIAAAYGAEPVFITVSATAAEPGLTAERLTGLAASEVTDDGSARGGLQFLLWEPPLLPGTEPETAGRPTGGPVRRSAIAETGELLADLVADGTATLAFIASRRGAEAVASIARRLLAEVDPELGERVAAYRGGYLPEERRVLEADLRAGRLRGLASTNALELGIDVAGLDAVLICGWPGRRSSLWQQAGRAGRRGGEALAVLVARDDPLDSYLVHHPEAIFGAPVEATVLDPDNPYVLAAQLCAAAAELPLTDADLAMFGPSTVDVLAALTARGVLRQRPTGWYWTRSDRAGDLADLRGTGGEPTRIVDRATGRLLGTVDAAATHHSVHPGAVYLHQGDPWLVRDLDLDQHVALVDPTGGSVVTNARDVTDIRILATGEQSDWAAVQLYLGTVEVTTQVVSYARKDIRTGEVLGEEPLDLPARTLRTAAVWWTMPEALLAAAGIAAEVIPGAAHAAEHAAIGIMPLVATCDRWDIGGVSTALHPDTGLPTIFVHDGHPGGAGFAERGYRCAQRWLTATRDVIRDCPCEAGCPSCVQSPKCGNGNHPLDKLAAVALLDAVLRDATP